MAKEDPSYYALTLRRGETKSIPLTFGPRDKSLPRYVITGQPVELRIKPKGEAEIVKNSAPHISVTDGPNGVATLAYPGSEVAAFTFQNAQFAILLNGERWIYGDLTIKDLYE
jgi:hypothetical protein